MDQHPLTPSIGGSDVGAILGVNPWTSPLQVWRRIVGLDPPQPDNPSMAEGRAMEPVILREYEEDQGCRVLRPPMGGDGWRRWSPDGIAIFPSGESRIVEAKWSSRGLPEVPASYWLQVQWYMHHLELERADLAVREPGRRTRVVSVEYDAGTMREVVTAVEAWYERHVLGGEPPEPAGADERVAVALSRVRDRGVVLRPDQALDAQVREMLAAREHVRELEARVKEAEAALLEAMAAVGAVRVESLSGWTATLVERSGAVRWREVAEALGAGARPDLVEKYRGAASRYIKFSSSSKGDES